MASSSFHAPTWNWPTEASPSHAPNSFFQPHPFEQGIHQPTPTPLWHSQPTPQRLALSAPTQLYTPPRTPSPIPPMIWNPDPTSSPEPSPSPEAPFKLQPQSRLLSLPGELRNLIYAYLLLAPPPLHPAILSTCRQAAFEATPLLYSHTFTAHPTLLTSLPHLQVQPHLSLPTLHAQPHVYPPVLAPRCLRLIRRWRIVLRVDVDPRFTAAAAARAFSGAEAVEIEVRQSSWGGCAVEPVLGLFAGVKGVGRAVVKGVGEEGEGFSRMLEGIMMSQSMEGIGGVMGEKEGRCQWKCRRCGFVDVGGCGLGEWYEGM